MKNFIKHRFKRLINKDFDLAKFWQYRDYKKNHQLIKPLVIYQMGKVGSSSLVHSLENMPIKYDLFHIHVLRKDWVRKLQEQYRYTSKSHGKAIIHEHMLASMFLSEALDSNSHPNRWKIISLVRDPVSRNLSAFFETLPTYFPDIAQYDEHNESLEKRIPELIDVFLNRFQEHKTPLQWFDMHMKPLFGIDVMASSFPQKQGYKIYNDETADLLVIRLEDLTRKVTPAMYEFLDVENFELTNANITEKKTYAGAYNKFKKYIQLPEMYLNQMYESKYARLFYSKNEIEKMRSRWE